MSPHRASPPAVLREDDGYVTAANAQELAAFHPSVVLVSPQIPQNTGSIARVCAAFSAWLHLVEPMAFALDEKKVRRAGLDYWPYVQLRQHASWERYLDAVGASQRLVFIETGSSGEPHGFTFLPGDALVFGSETLGLEDSQLELARSRGNPVSVLTIPMFNRGVRSINLSNAVSIALYTAIASLHRG